MSDILIKGIKLPKDEPGAFQVIVMYVGADGKLRAECKGTHEVVHVPPHGRTIDADALAEYVCQQSDWLSETAIHTFCGILRKAPTIIPAEEGE